MPQSREDYGLSPLELRVVAAVLQFGRACQVEIRDRIMDQSSLYVHTKNWRTILRRLHIADFLEVHYLPNEKERFRQQYTATPKAFRAIEKAAHYHRFFAELSENAVRNYRRYKEKTWETS